MINQTISHYRIVEKLGGGGMGVVYKAEDTKLHRFVALKFLPDEVAKDPQALTRFQREARAVAALNHPNVVTVYSVEELDNVYFITMELIEGQPLDHLISTNGLPTDRIIEIAGAIAEALAAAHEKGIVHRDLKPANVMVTHEGRVKVLDFGLAKEVGAENANDTTFTSAGCTQAGMVMGTPAYMSPEQVSGRPLDHRSDIFSFGVVLHEMATGRRPFVGSSSAELISSILRDTPPSVTEARPELPSDLARVIRRCLEKDPRYRVQTARDLSNEFRDLARTTTRPTPLSTSPVRATVGADSGAARADEGFWVAVLPFKYTGSSADLKALAEGLSEEVITGLSRFSYLRVIARGSAAMHSSESGDVRVIRKELGAHYVMEGTLRQAGPKMRLAVHLVDATTGAHLWAENYERTFIPEAIFELQDTLVPRIVSTVAGMHGMLPQSMSETVRGRDPEQLNPYEAVLRGFGYFERATAEELAAARKGLEFAVRKAPAYSDAWAMLSLLCTQDYGQGFNLQPDSLQRGLAAARRAVETGPSNHLAYCAQAYARFFEKDFPNFRTAADRSVEINPMDATCLAEIGVMLVHAGFHERGLALAARARQLNPNYSGRYWWGDFHNAYRQRDYRAALDIAGKIELPKHWAAMCMLAAAGQLGDRSVAEKALREVRSFRSDFVTRVRNEGRKWMSPEMTEHFIEGLRKAGLQIASEGKSAP